MGSGNVVEIKISVSTTFLQPFAFLTGPVANLNENDPDLKIEVKSNNIFEHTPFE